MFLLYKIPKEKLEKIFFWLVVLILATGIVVRVAVYLQNRNLFIDEANLARNIYERSYGGFFKPLTYEQFAPPLWLCIEKLLGALFGYSEYVLRIYPLLAGIGTLFLLTMILKRLTSYSALWYPLGMLAVAFIFIRYSSELKQYSSDAFIALLLIFLALKIDPEKTKTRDFLLIWIFTGSIAILMSMPAVFVLPAVSLYYGVMSLQQKKYAVLLPIGISSCIWIVVFGSYYFTSLKPQIGLKYLQSFHEDYFLYLIPKTKIELIHNWEVFREKLCEVAGYDYYTLKFNIVLMVIAVVRFTRKHPAAGLLVITPIIFVLVAAGMHLFTLIPRVSLFMMPLLLILIGYGFEGLMCIRFWWAQALLLIFGLHFIKNHNVLKFIYTPFAPKEQLTDGLAYLKGHHITGDELYVNIAAVPAFKYYTQMHPQKRQWEQLKDAHFVHWSQYYGELSNKINDTATHDTAAFIYTSVMSDDLKLKKQELGMGLKLVDSFERYDISAFAYLYIKRPKPAH